MDSEQSGAECRIDVLTLPIAIIVAAAENGVIGDDNRLLWRLRTDLRRFRARTLGKPVIMGRKTFESIGKPLPGRDTIVLTRDSAFAVEGVSVASGIEQALEKAHALAGSSGAQEIMIAGGADVYRQFLPFAHRIYLTRVAVTVPGDATFPDVDTGRFRVTAREAHPQGPDDEHAFAFVDYMRCGEELVSSGA